MERDHVHALMIDDDQGDFLFTQALVSQIQHPSVSLEWVSTFEEGLDALTATNFDLFLVDYFLEDRTGLDLLREARRQGIKTPMIMLTGRGSHDVDVEAMRAGAADYLVKGEIDPEKVERAFRYALDRSDTQRALVESEEKHRSMFDHLPVGLYRVSAEGEFMDANPSLVRCLGHPDLNRLQTAYASNFFVAPADVAGFRAQLEQFGVVRGFTSQLRTTDGTAVRVRNTARTHRGADGSVEYIEGAVVDISDVLTEGGFDRHAARYERLVADVDIGVIFAQTDGAITETNPLVTKELGYRRDELAELHLTGLFADEDREPIERDIRSLATGAAESCEGHRRLLTADGEVRWGRVTLSAIRDVDGQAEEIMALISELDE